MSRRDSSDSSSADERPATPSPLCVICDQAADGVGPFSRCHLCQKHLSVDVADAHKLKEEVAEQLRAYSQGAGAASGVAALGLGEGQSAGSLRLHIRQHLQQVEQRFDQVQRDLDSFLRRVTGQLESLIEALSVCERDLEDVSSYKQEVKTAEASGDMSELVYLVESMQASLGDLEADFERAASLQREQSDSAEQQLRLLGQLERLIGSCGGGADATDRSRDAAVAERSTEIDAALGKIMPPFDPIVFSHEVKLNNKLNIDCLAVCSYTSGFHGDRSGYVLPANLAGDGSEDLPQPCIIASFHPNKHHLLVLTVDGSQKLRCHCDIDWKKDIRGLHCDRQLLFIAQDDAVTVTDLSGRAVHQIRPHIEGFGGIMGIGGSAASVFVSSGNKIAAFSKATGQMETVITLSQLPYAQLGNLVIHDNCILVTDWKHNQVHRVRIGTQQLVASHPTQRAGLHQFAYPYRVAVDRRGRLFVSDIDGDSVRAVSADDGSLLWTLGDPGERGNGDGRLCNPSGLAVVTKGSREQLVVADGGNSRLLVFNL